jgi:Asp/Glu/hydantoin racemase
MKLLIINPNVSESVTALIKTEARRSASPDTGHGTTRQEAVKQGQV